MLKTIIDPVARCVVRVITDNDPNPGQFLLYYRTRVNSTLSGFRLKGPPIRQQHGLDVRILSSVPVDTASGAEPAKGCRLNLKTETDTPELVHQELVHQWFLLAGRGWIIIPKDTQPVGPATALIEAMPTSDNFLPDRFDGPQHSG